MSTFIYFGKYIYFMCVHMVYFSRRGANVDNMRGVKFSKIENIFINQYILLESVDFSGVTTSNTNILFN